jgi:hypothetical protein
MFLSVYENTWRHVTFENLHEVSRGKVSLNSTEYKSVNFSWQCCKLHYIRYAFGRSNPANQNPFTFNEMRMTAAGQAAGRRAVAEIIQVSERKFNFLRPPAGLVVLLPSWPTVFLITN